jgi:hypothetical protein
MKDFGPGKPLCSETGQVLPRHPALLAATLQYPQPAFAHFTPKALETGEVSGNGMLVEVALYHAPQPFPDFRQRLMHALPEFVLHLFQLGEESLSDGFAQHEELAVLPGLSAYVRESQEVKRLRLALSPLLPVYGCKPPKLNQAGLVRMVVPTQTSAVVPAIPVGNVPLPLDAETPAPYRPHTEPQ